MRLLCLLTWSLMGVYRAYKPVVFMHGLLQNEDAANTLFSLLNEFHPGTDMYSIDQFNDLKSFQSMNKQVKKIGAEMMEVMKQHPEGIHLVCNSQGGLVCRGILEKFTHNVDTFISLASPQAGQYGLAEPWKKYLPKFTVKYIYKFFYTPVGQKFSIANYWNDPHHHDLYVNQSSFLAAINSDKQTNQTAEYKRNFLRLKKLVLIGGPDDRVISPWQSSFFGFYNNKDKVVDMKHQQWYVKDTFGLRTLDTQKRLVIHLVPGVLHHYFHVNRTVLKNFVLPYLT